MPWNFVHFVYFDWNCCQCYHNISWCTYFIASITQCRLPVVEIAGKFIDFSLIFSIHKSPTVNRNVWIIYTVCLDTQADRNIFFCCWANLTTLFSLRTLSSLFHALSRPPLSLPLSLSLASFIIHPISFFHFMPFSVKAKINCRAVHRFQFSAV